MTSRKYGGSGLPLALAQTRRAGRSTVPQAFGTKHNGRYTQQHANRDRYDEHDRKGIFLVLVRFVFGDLEQLQADASRQRDEKGER